MPENDAKQHQSLQVEIDSYPSFEQLLPAVPEAYKIPGFPYSDSTDSFFFFFFYLRPVELSLPSPDKHKEINIGNKGKGRVNTATSGNFTGQFLRQFFLNFLLLDTLVLLLCPIYKSLERNIFHTDNNDLLVSHETNLMDYGQHFFLMK